MNSKSTGIIRRIDDLGRVVIPKEIRRTLSIREGDPLEIFVTEDTVMFQKYSVLGSLNKCGDILRGLYRLFESPVLLCDRNQAIDACGISKEEYENRCVSDAVSQWMERDVLTVIDGTNPIPILNGSELTADIAQPIRACGDLHGAIVMLNKKSGKSSNVPQEIRQSGLKLAAQIIASMIET